MSRPLMGTPDCPNYAWPFTLAWRYPFQTLALLGFVVAAIALYRTF